MTSSELEQQLARLDARGADLAETSAELPRGALPALFRALAAAPRPEQEAAVVRLARRLPDAPLADPTLEAVRRLDLAAPFQEALRAATTDPDAWCSLDQVALLDALGPTPAQLLRLLELLLEGEGGAGASDATTELAVELGVEETCEALRQLLRRRLGGRAERRDRTSARLTRGAIRALVRIAPDDPRLQRAISQVLAAETRRAGKGEAVLALEALDALAQAPPLTRIRLLVPALDVLRGLRKRKVIERAEAAIDAAAAELGAGADEVAEITARTGGLDPDGWARVPLEEGEARLGIDAAGAVVRADVPDRLDPADARTLASAERELVAARSELARRLEAALVSGRAWSGTLWRAVFLHHVLWRDLARRLTWELRGEERTAFELRADATGALQPTDLFGEPVDLLEAAQVGLVHPVTLDADELELWRDRALEREHLAPFPQLFRRVLPPEEGAEGGPLARFVGREAYRDALADVARRSGWAGLPLEGRPPWEVWRELPGRGSRAVVELEEVVTPVRRAATKKKAGAPGKSAPPPPKEAAPRVRILGCAVEPLGDEAPDPAGTAEVVKDLEELSDPLARPTELFLRTWQQRKWREPQEAWREVVLLYRQGSPAELDVRRFLLRALLAREGFEVRIEDRFAITRQHVIELGTGLVHEGPQKDHLPGWKADDLAAEGNEGRPPLRFPFAPDADLDTVRVVTLAVGLVRWDAAREA